jgi:hypothetical protein
MSSWVWEAVDEGNGWRAWLGPSADGRLWDTRECCQAYIDEVLTALDRSGAADAGGRRA